MDKSRILIADDHSMVRDGIKTLLKQNKSYEVAGEAVNGREAREMYKLLKSDLLIMDISMPDLNGMEVAREILQEDPEARIVMLSMYDDEDYISLCMEYGVKGYVVKNETGSELDYAVKTVLKGQNYFSKQVQQVIFKKYSNNVIRKKSKEPEVKLTTREIEILRLISDGLTSHQMAEKLFISPRTVETHRANLMKKTGSRNSIELMKKAQLMKIL